MNKSKLKSYHPHLFPVFIHISESITGQRRLAFFGLHFFKSSQKKKIRELNQLRREWNHNDRVGGIVGQKIVKIAKLINISNSKEVILKATFLILFSNYRRGLLKYMKEKNVQKFDFKLFLVKLLIPQ